MEAVGIISSENNTAQVVRDSAWEGPLTLDQWCQTYPSLRFTYFISKYFVK